MAEARTFEHTDDPTYPCSLCGVFVCGWCLKPTCDDDCPGVLDQGAIVPIDETGEVTRLYTGTHRWCREALAAYNEDIRNDPT